MFNMKVHVPVQIAIDGVHVHRTAIKAVIEHVFCQPGVLGVPVHNHKPGTINIGQTNIHEREYAAGQNRQNDHPGVDQHVDACHGN